jgi:hypothetical protein
MKERRKTFRDTQAAKGGGPWWFPSAHVVALLRVILFQALLCRQACWVHHEDAPVRDR